MGKSKQNSNFDSQARGMHRDEDDLGYLDHDLTDDTMITPDARPAGEATTAGPATIQAKTKTRPDQQVGLQDKRANQSDR